jgi:tRNA wybutosine-synthesizing protein 1
MLSPERRESLKHMYELVGTHSAVKLCRWQKSMLRGQGGCYKWTCYGIASHRCMEATPSLGCANKCTFCWRLNTNPTIKEWNFETDEPRNLVAQMLDTHVGLVHDNRGLPGATTDRLAEAKKPVHCALSLVGEPIIYPRINEFLDELHVRGVSSFLVNNGQFPEQIATLRPITQLYLSVDAATKEKMRELDRPIFSDFWERFNRSVRLMAARPERAVFRLTMVEGYNMDDSDVQHHANLIATGKPGLIELKQLTPAFQGRKTPLRISNVPTWDRMLDFARRLCDACNAGGAADFAIASLHEHSHCILLARKSQFAVNGAWYTWIDFDKFNKLTAADRASGLDKEFVEVDSALTPADAAAAGVQQTSSGAVSSPSTAITLRRPKVSWTWQDYMLRTPDWAAYKEGTATSTPRGSGGGGVGFDPTQVRPLSAKAAKHAQKQAQSESDAAVAGLDK